MNSGKSWPNVVTAVVSSKVVIRSLTFVGRTLQRDRDLIHFALSLRALLRRANVRSVRSMHNNVILFLAGCLSEFSVILCHLTMLFIFVTFPSICIDGIKSPNIKMATTNVM